MTFLNRTTTPSKNKTFFTKNVKTVTLRTDCSYSQKVSVQRCLYAASPVIFMWL